MVGHINTQKHKPHFTFFLNQQKMAPNSELMYNLSASMELQKITLCSEWNMRLVFNIMFYLFE